MNSREFFSTHKQRFIKEISELVAIPSISTQPEHQSDIIRAATWVEMKLAALGCDRVKQLSKGNGNPVVFGEKIFDPSLPTLLLYGHYDVQPADPLAAWSSDPFLPVVRDGALYGRGTTDNKAQFMTNIAALEYYFAEQKEKTWNIKIVIEGEEEIGGPTIDAMIEDPDFTEYFSANYAYISDGPWVSRDMPSIEYSLRGLVYFDLELRTSQSDMHSGLYGNAVLNPANLAGYVIYKLKDILANRIRVPNIYKSMRRLSQEEITQINEGSMTWEDVKNNSGALVTTPYRRRGESFSPAILTGTRPSLDVHGISSGFTEKGQMKTIIPASALVKFSIRLVPQMTPHETTVLVEKYLKKIMPKGVEYTLTVLNSSKPYITSPQDSRIEQLCLEYEKAFGKRPHLTPSGGSIGLVTTLADRFGMVSLLASYGLPDDRLHGPDEKYDLSQLEGGYLTLTGFLEKS